MITIFNKEIPDNPGVYLMKNNSKVIYVGKLKTCLKEFLPISIEITKMKKPKNLLNILMT